MITPNLLPSSKLFISIHYSQLQRGQEILSLKTGYFSLDWNEENEAGPSKKPGVLTKNNNIQKDSEIKISLLFS